VSRRAAYHVRLANGHEIGFGLIVRDPKLRVYSVQYRDPDDQKYVIRSTGERSRPRAISAAEQIVRDHYEPAILGPNKRISWDELLVQLRQHLEADGARPSTISDYLDTIQQVRTAATTPARITVPIAQAWCNAYLSGEFTRGKVEGSIAYRRSPRTLHSRVRKLKALWGKYLIKRLRVADQNPWESMDLPKLDKQSVRTLSAEQVNAFFSWLGTRWKGWPLPTLFFETKAVTGCRLGDLCEVRSSSLREGKLYFTAGTTKARRERVAVLPPDLYESLRKIAGRTYLWESYVTELPHFLKLREVPTHRRNPVFDPKRLNWWAMDEIDDFNKAHPGQPKIQSHDFRKRAITEAHRAGLDVDTAAAAVGMSPATARTYYLAIDQEKASEVLTQKLGTTLRPTISEQKDAAISTQDREESTTT
jgi:integrase